MSKREDFIGTRVSEQEKRDIIEFAKGMDITVSDFIRHRIIRPYMTIPEAVQNLKLYIDSKLNSFIYKITETIKEQSFNREPLQKRMTIIEEYNTPIEKIIKHPSKVINITGITLEKTLLMRNVLKEMKKKEFILNEVPLEILERERPIPDPIAYLEWKIKIKGRKRLRESSVFLS